MGKVTEFKHPRPRQHFTIQIIVTVTEDKFSVDSTIPDPAMVRAMLAEVLAELAHTDVT